LRLVLQMSAAPRQSTSFPTRRSSDLATRRPPSTRRYNACCWAGCSPSASPRPRSSMPFALPSPDVSRAVLAQRLLVAACLLMMLGSSIYAVPPLRPFHWGLALLALAFCIDAPTRRSLLQSRVLPAAVAVMLLVCVQALWAHNVPRYAQYAVIFIISLSYALL